MSALGSIPFALEAFAQHLAVAADRFRFFANPALRRFLVGAAPLHVPESALTLHFLLEHPQGGIDIVVAYEHLHRRDAFLVVAALTSAQKAKKGEPRSGLPSVEPGRGYA